VSLKLQIGAVGTQDNISTKLKVKGVADTENIDKAEAIIKEGVQTALDKLEEY
jgi:hypothetical protein